MHGQLKENRPPLVNVSPQAARQGTTLLGCRYDLDSGDAGGIVYLLNDNSGDGFVFQHLIERRDSTNTGPVTRDLEHQWLEKSVTREMDEFDSENQNATKIAALYNPNHEPEHRLYGESIIPCCFGCKNYRCVLDHSVRNQKFPHP